MEARQFPSNELREFRAHSEAPNDFIFFDVLVAAPHPVAGFCGEFRQI
jgi:hypothetical protein